MSEAVDLLCIMVLGLIFMSDISDAKCTCCKEINDCCCETKSERTKHACCSSNGDIRNHDWSRSQCPQIQVNSANEIKVTIERDSNGTFGFSIRRGTNVIDYISPGGPAALHGGINAGDMIIEINSIPVDEKSDVMKLFSNIGQTLRMVIRKKDIIGELEYAFDGMQQFMKKHIIKNPSAPEKINRRFLSKLVTCLNELDPNLLESVNAQWEGFKKFSKVEGGEWKRCNLNGTDQWNEDNCNVQTYENITIREPCNFASSVAYYHTVTEICSRKNWSMPPKSVKAIGKGLALLAFGSSFFHASQTELGGEADSRMIDLTFWIMYQEAISFVRPDVTNVTNMNSKEFFGVPDTVLIRDLSYKPRKMNAIETADYVIKVFMEESVEEWHNIIANLDVPNKEIMKLAIDNELARKRLKIDEDGKEDIPTPDFITNNFRGFFPAMVNSIDNIKVGGEKELPEEDINILFKNMLGGWVKMLYGVLWQEQLIDLKEIEDINKQLEFDTKIGWKLLPFINQLANSLTEFDHTNLDFQSAKDIYPGQNSCAGKRHSHAMWHVQSGIAMLDFALIADEFYRIMNLFNINDLQCDKNIANESLTERVGGPDACQVKAHSKPWMVSFRPYVKCGGTLVTKRVVLTAAHCIAPQHIKGEGHVIVGEHDTKKNEFGQQVLRVKTAKIHESFTAGSLCGYLIDIGLVFLEQEAVLNDKVQLASLPDPNQECPSGNSLILSGWGKDPFTPSRDPHILWAVKQGCLDIEKCNRVTDPHECKKYVLCVGDEREPRNSGFQEDSGGPLTYTDTEGKTTTFGIVSGPGNITNLPISTTAVFVRLSNPDILDWIWEGIKSNNN